MFSAIEFSVKYLAALEAGKPILSSLFSKNTFACVDVSFENFTTSLESFATLRAFIFVSVSIFSILVHVNSFVLSNERRT